MALTVQDRHIFWLTKWLTPFFFGVYVDELSLCLRSVNIGCRLSNMIVNHLLFADDAVIFAPSAKGLQQLLDSLTHSLLRLTS